MLLDSNILIYAVQPHYDSLRQWLAQQPNLGLSEISRLEVLGYYRLTEVDRQDFNRLFSTLYVYPISPAVIDFAIYLRQQRKMSLGDAIIAATASENRQTLITRNIEDFDWIEGLKLINPFSEMNNS
ncbi:MAG: type II toxin-antitoxin system VapC family toxin [Gammaproteobacteria bacterium]